MPMLPVIGVQSGRTSAPIRTQAVQTILGQVSSGSQSPLSFALRLPRAIRAADESSQLLGAARIVIWPIASARPNVPNVSLSRQLGICSGFFKGDRSAHVQLDGKPRRFRDACPCLGRATPKATLH